MSTYKLIQDIEAEDHILGPLTLRQFIFALIAVFFFYICFIFISKGIWWGLIFFAPPGLFFGFFAFPWGRDQPTEIWALAKIRFMMVPRRRIWSQSGIKEMVTINVPKREEKHLTDELSQTEVKSRLKALATTIDSRGWSVKNANVNLSSGLTQPMAGDSDRLVGLSSLPQAVPTIDVQASDDIMDEYSSPVSQQLQQMISTNEANHRQALLQQMNGTAPAPTTNGWFAAPTAAPVQSEADLSAQLKAQSQGGPSPTSHLRTVAPLGAAAPAKPVTASPAAPDPAILSLAGNNDLSVAALAREAYKAKHDGASPDEVVISLQ